MRETESAVKPDAFQQTMDSLNPKQRQAVETIEGPVLVVAGPGTGKTQIIATRIAHILSTPDAQAQPHNILCLTYTEAGAIAMRRRLLQIIGTDAHKLTIETFHAFCNTVIQQHAEYFGKRDLEPLSDLERFALLEDIINQLEATHPLKRLKGEVYFEAGRLSQLFATMKQEGWDLVKICGEADRYLADLPHRDDFIYKRNSGGNKKGDVKQHLVLAEKDKMELLKAAAMLFPVYSEKMHAIGRYDYHDMILWVIDSFRRHESLLRNYQERYQYVLVDEFQDTNGSQNEILNLLTNYWETPNVFCVGDDDQGIYEFQGARIKNIRDFMHRYGKSLAFIILRENYRSTQAILDTARKVIDQNQLRLSEAGGEFEKILLAALPREDAAGPLVQEYANDLQEMAGILLQVESLRQKKVPDHEIAILYYRHAHASPLIDLFERKEIPYQVNRNVNILELVEVQQLLDMLRFMAAELSRPHTNDFLLFEIMHCRWFELQAVDIATISFFSRNTKKALPWRLLLQDEKFLASIPLKDPDGIRAFSRRLEHWLAEAGSLTLPMIFEKIINEGGYVHHVLQSADKSWNLQVLHTLFSYIQREALKNPKISIRSFTQMVEQMETHRIPVNLVKTSGHENGVVFSTCHSAKGLEFEHVFLMGCSDKGWERAQSGSRNYSLPDTLTFSTEENALESLRRLFYVGMTRAKSGLYISYAVMNPEGRQKVASRFVTETGLTPQLQVVEASKFTTLLGDLMKQAPPPVAAKVEKSLVEKRLLNFALSPSSLNAYLDCPVRFYYEQIIGIPSAANDSMAFGSAVHYALQKLFEKMKASGDVFPPAQDFINDFTGFMLRNRLAFTEKQFENRMSLGRQLLPEFYQAYVQQWNKITVLEYMIKNVTVHGIPLKGKLDKLEFRGKEVTVVDYKTGSLVNARLKGKLDRPSEKNPAGGDYWRQLVFYKLLVDNHKAKDWRMVRGVIDFIELNSKTGEFQQFPLEVSREDLEFVTRQITETWDGIMQHRFYEGCGKEDCGWCRFLKNHETAEALAATINQAELLPDET